MERTDPGCLFIKSFTGTAEPEEEKVLRSWLDESEENRREYEASRKLWEESSRLVLSASIDTESALKKTKSRIPRFRAGSKLLVFARQAAAVFLLAVLLSAIAGYFLNRRPADPEQIVYQEVKAAWGTQTKVVLPDSTLVWLNSGSTLRFPLSFQDTENRIVELEGEGYFEVTKNSQQPFLVSIGQMRVKVLGTSFNINAYEAEEHLEVALLEGKVELLKETKAGMASILALNPSEVADFSTGSNRVIHKKETEIDRYAAWKDGKIVFFDDPVEKLVSRLENWYNVDIEIAEERLKRYHFTATFGPESLDQVLKYLSISTPIRYRFILPPKTDGQSASRTKVVLF